MARPGAKALLGLHLTGVHLHSLSWTPCNTTEALRHRSHAQPHPGHGAFKKGVEVVVVPVVPRKARTRCGIYMLLISP